MSENLDASLSPMIRRDDYGVIQRYWKMGHGDQPEQRVITLSALNALLAVAKAAEPFIPFQTPEDAASCGCGGCVLRRSIAALAPGWREWGS